MQTKHSQIDRLHRLGFITLPELANQVGMSEASLWYHIHKGHIPYGKVGYYYAFGPKQIQAIKDYFSLKEYNA